MTTLKQLREDVLTGTIGLKKARVQYGVLGGGSGKHPITGLGGADMPNMNKNRIARTAANITRDAVLAAQKTGDKKRIEVAKQTAKGAREHVKAIPTKSAFLSYKKADDTITIHKT